MSGGEPFSSLLSVRLCASVHELDAQAVLYSNNVSVGHGNIWVMCLIHRQNMKERPKVSSSPVWSQYKDLHIVMKHCVVQGYITYYILYFHSLFDRFSEH